MSSGNSEEKITAALELLLDTMCDMFGTVMFISMLIVIMTSQTSRKSTITVPTGSAEELMADHERELAAQRAELETLQNAVEQQAAIDANVVNPRSRDLLEEVRRLRSQRADLATENGKALEEASRSQTDVNRIARDLKQLDERMAAAKAALAVVEQRLQKEIATRSRTARLPRLRETKKEEIPFFLKQGRLTPYYVRAASDGTFVSNRAKILESAEGRLKLVEPRAGAGIAVNLDGDPTDLAASFADFQPEKHYLAIFVWPDSFDSFAPVRESMVLGRFEYRLVVIPQGKKVAIGADSGQSRLVQ